jgi:hypothetical protein
MQGRSVSPWASVAVCAATVLASCYSQSPLDPSPQSPLDQKLLGTWRCVSPDPVKAEVATAGFAVGPVTKDGEYLLTWGAPNEEADSYRAFTSVLGDSTFLNVRPLQEDQYTGWTFLRYSFLRANVLYVELVSNEPFKEKESTASAAAARATLERALRSTPETLEEYVVCFKTAKRDAS